MRELKFRAWDKGKRIMVYQNENDSADYWDGVHASEIELVNSILKDSSYEFMQYTGFKDRNGREIYEGDIVIAWSAGVKAICEVKWGQGRAGFFLYRKPNIAWNLSGGGKDYNEENVEVIGNIFQDGDLLDSEISKVDRD